MNPCRTLSGFMFATCACCAVAWARRSSPSSARASRRPPRHLLIAAGPDGNLWFTEKRRRPDRADHAERACHRVQRRHHGQRRLRGITAGPRRQPLVHRDAATGSGGSRRPASSPSSAPASRAGAHPVGITAGPDGNLWFTECGGNRIGRITTGRASSPSSAPASRRGALPAGHHGRPRRQPVVHRDTTATGSGGSRPAGVVTEFSAGITAGASLQRHRRRPRRQPLVRRNSAATGSGGSRRRASSPNSAPA